MINGNVQEAGAHDDHDHGDGGHGGGHGGQAHREEFEFGEIFVRQIQCQILHH